MSATDEKIRYAPGRLEEDGTYLFSCHLTSSDKTDLVCLVMPPMEVLPVIFVPGIMGSNLRTKERKEFVWRLDNSKKWNWIPAVKNKALDLALDMDPDPGVRQKLLHPERVEVDPGGAVPKKIYGHPPFCKLILYDVVRLA